MDTKMSVDNGGIPAMVNMVKKTKDTSVTVAEISSFQLETIKEFNNMDLTYLQQSSTPSSSVGTSMKSTSTAWLILTMV